MSISIQYETLEEADMRLRNTVIFYEGEPVFVYKVSAGKPLRVHFVSLPLIPYVPAKHRQALDAGKIETFRIDGATNYVIEDSNRKYISSKNFDYGASKVGFVSMEDNNKAPMWFGRNTQRQYRQGLTGKTCVNSNVPEFDDNPDLTTYEALRFRGRGEGNLFEELLQQQSFIDSLRGKNSTLTLTQPAATSEGSKPFGVINESLFWFKSRDFKLIYLVDQDYKKIGLFDRTTKSFGIPKRFQYMTDALKQARVAHHIIQENQ